MKIFQSVVFLFFTLVYLTGPRQSTCDTTDVASDDNCSTSGDKCHLRHASPVGSESVEQPQGIPQAQAQSGLASIETAAAAAVAATTSQKTFSLNTPFAELKAPIDTLNGIPAAYGDFDSDHFVDLYVGLELYCSLTPVVAFF